MSLVSRPNCFQHFRPVGLIRVMNSLPCSGTVHWRRTGRHRYHATRPQTRQQQRLSAQEHPYPLTGLDQPVYSLATLASTGGTPTMNIVTYCAPMSIQPRTVALGLFKGTQSWENFLANKVGVLQVLREGHMALFPLLGKTSAASNANKLSLLGEQHPLVNIFDHQALADCHGYVLLKMMKEPVDAGDHDVVICSVAEYEQHGESTADVLSTGTLRSHGLM